MINTIHTLFRQQKTTIYLLLLIIIGAFLRFYNLSWGEPYFFHPDERNIAASVSQLSFPDQLNPNFFAYGSLPIYVIYLTGIYIHLLLGTGEVTVPFAEAILISRAYSALFSTLLIPLLYILGKKLLNEKAGLLTATLAVFLTGFLQFAHFGTFEMWLTLGSVLLFYTSLCYFEKNNVKNLLLLSVLFGILCSIKISSLFLLLIPVGVIMLSHRQQMIKRQFLPVFNHLTLFTIVGTAIFSLTNPFVFFDTASFENSMQYESGVALGTLSVFYTGEFVTSIPVLYPLFSVYPFLLNPVLTLISIPALFFCIFTALRKRNRSYLLLCSFFAILFFSQAFLFVKWTRYYVPTLPFLLLIVGTAVSLLYKKHHPHRLLHFSVGALIITTVLFGLSYFITAFVEPDTRIQARNYAENHIPKKSSILSEVYDLGIVPFNSTFPAIHLYDFYSIENNETVSADLKKITAGQDYILLPSQRLWKVRLQNEKAFPNGHAFYRQLFDGTLGYDLVYQTPCSIWCRITYLSDPVFLYEGTASVFERPTVTLFQKR